LAAQITPGLTDENAIRLVGRLLEEQVVVLDNAQARIEAKGAALDDATRASATAAATASMMSVSLAVNHVVERVESISPQLLNVINNGIYQYVQKLMVLLPYLNAQQLTVTLTTSMPPAATLSLTIRP
jgi:hypothetical protein